MLCARNLTLGYNANTIPIRNFSYTFNNGVYAVTGASGSGKSTLLKGLAGLLTPMEGNVLNTCDKVAMVFQESRLIMSYTPEQNLSLVCKSQERVAQALEQTSLTDFAQKSVSKLSGGQMRRVALARAIAYGGDCLILDEPFEGLDSNLKAKIAMHLALEFPLIIISTHDFDDVLLLSDKKPVRIELE